MADVRPYPFTQSSIVNNAVKRISSAKNASFFVWLSVEGSGGKVQLHHSLVIVAARAGGIISIVMVMMASHKHNGCSRKGVECGIASVPESSTFI